MSAKRSKTKAQELSAGETDEPLCTQAANDLGAWAG